MLGDEEMPTLTPLPPKYLDVMCASPGELEGGEAGKGQKGHLLQDERG